MDWYPTLPFGEGPRYLQIVAALRNDIATGAVASGQRLPTHREMAAKLGLSVGTVSKAYAAAERGGLISGQVGRGTFVSPSTPDIGVSENATNESQRVNLALNAPPDTGESEALAATLSEIAADPNFSRLMGYLPHQGLEAHRTIVADWLSEVHSPTAATGVYITQGAQHAISVAMRLLARPGSPVLVENMTYSGMTSLAIMEGYNLAGVAMDEEGLIPAALEAAFSQTGASVLYCTPTLQAATGAIMSAERRREVAEIVRRHDAWIVEDDTYGFLCETPPPTLSSLLPERSFYVVSFAKCLAPGLRIGAMTAPVQFRDRIINAIRSTGWMANAIMAEAVTRMIRSGELDRQIVRKRAAAAERTGLAQDILGHHLQKVSVPAFHVWLNMPAGRTSSGLSAQAALSDVTLVPPNPLSATSGGRDGLRLCLGAARSTDSLVRALITLSEILSDTEEMALI
ncbi:MAG: PLP-dependent aminotransferase family protein [Vannielia sp.]|uniref:aminotransferase-like domain-containing protein n=1 Tax=Rhodobacterales TaxID=204455 RepID=UPI0020956F30|nr:PLP-dependent aminotransferase family protein [Oceanicola sp. 502str15]MCO6381535.1 aminotransferase class I/II-fold pyridoxal phosphate-dependent enzyme [Oceanicola sp. 502str15]